MAERFWPGRDAVGRRFKIGPADTPNPWLTVVGIVGDVRQTSLDQQLKPEMYLPYRQDRRLFAVPRDLVVRTGGDPMSLAASVRAEIWKIDKNLPLYRVQTMEQVLSQSVTGPRFHALLLMIFAALALMLAAVGIYGVMSYTTAQRTREIRIRMALGAEKRDVLVWLLRDGVVVTIIGIVTGLIGALALTRVMEGLMFGVSVTDPSTFALFSALLAAVSLVACCLPAIRATGR